MKINVLELAEQLRPQSIDTPVIVGECFWHRPRDKTAWVWVFEASSNSRLKFLWSGVLARPEIASIQVELAQTNSVWHALLDKDAFEGSRRTRLLWTLAPAPCRVYKRRRLKLEVEPSHVTAYGFWGRRQTAIVSVSSVEGWVSRGGGTAGITLRQNGRRDFRILRVMNNLFAQEFDVTYDAIDLWNDAAWLEHVTQRVAGVFDAPWSIVDYTATPPVVVMFGHPGVTTATGDA
jgi:hypothetical protein